MLLLLAILPAVGMAESDSALLRAVHAGDEHRVRTALDHGDPADAALLEAVTHGRGRESGCNLDIVKLLLGHGADPRRADPASGRLPLLAAFEIGDLACAAALRDAGAPVDSRDRNGRTLLHAAVGAALTSGDAAPIDTALAWGVEKNAQANNGYTALHELVWDSAQESPYATLIARGLLDKGVDPCLKNAAGQTAVSMANVLHRNPLLIKIIAISANC
jgi:hypothetical protein